MAECCLTLICPPAIEEKLLDTLLATAGNEVFTSTPTFGHGTAPGRWSATEQVMGRSRAVQVQILLTATELAQLLTRLRADFAGAGLRYWVCPLSAEGEIA
jgi:hypothetical protein